MYCFTFSYFYNFLATKFHPALQNFASRKKKYPAQNQRHASTLIATPTTVALVEIYVPPMLHTAVVVRASNVRKNPTVMIHNHVIIYINV